jgi:hypothetical protein
MATSLLLDELRLGYGRTLRQAAALLPATRRERPVTPSCLVRWVRDGVRGPGGRRVRLEATRLAGRWVTTPQAIARFSAAQTPDAGDASPEPPLTPALARGRESGTGVSRADSGCEGAAS